MRRLMAIISLFSCGVNASGSNFSEGEKVAQSLKSSIAGNIKSGGGKSNVPSFQDGFSISETETSKTFEHAKNNEAAQAVSEIHENRGLYKFDENDPLIERSDKVQREPEKVLNEVESVEAGGDTYTIEYCEECSEEEYIVKARKVKKRYVYLQTPPFITAANYCDNHKWLSVRVEIPNEPEGIFREDGQFENIQLLGRNQAGAVVDERYSVNGYEITLRKTINQNGRPWIHPGCWMVPHLQNQVLGADYLIRELLGGSEDRDLNWGRLGKAHLTHRVVNDTGEHYWILDDKCQEYERLSDAGLCRYVSMVEDPETDKYWKGKKVRGSWGQTVTYACKYDDGTSNCKKLRLRGCEQIGSECIKTIEGKCVKWRQKYKCRDRVNSDKYKFSGESAFCLDGNCVDSSFKSDEDMIEALGYLSILENVRKDLNGTDKIDIFKGVTHSCARWLLSFKDCCVRHGWGMDIGLASCDKDSKELAQQRNEGKCIQVGTYCAEKLPLLGTCVRKKTVFCCFGNKFAKLLQEQGKKQLGQDFGSPESPNCRGFTAEELRKIDFSKLDLTEISQDVMNSFKPQLDPKKHFAKGDELQKIRESMKELPMLKNATEREGAILNENMKHMTSSTGGAK